MIKQLASLGMVGVMVLSALVLILSPITQAQNHGGGKPATPPGQVKNDEENQNKVNICHRTNSATNPYTTTPVNINAVDGEAGNSESLADHFGEHQGPLASSEAVANDLKFVQKKEWGDIIPPLGDNPGQNWTAEGQAIYNNNCNYLESEEPIQIKLKLTYIQECAVDEDNTWRVRNPSDRTILVNYSVYNGSITGTHTATSGDSFFTTPRASETMVITWGGGETGIVAGKDTKASGPDLSVEDERCFEEEEPELASVTTRIVPASCEAPASLFYSTVNASRIIDDIDTARVSAAMFSTADVASETEIVGPGTVNLFFIALPGAEFENGEGSLSLTFELDAQLTGDDCVLGENPEEPETPVTPETPETPEVLPETSGVTGASFAALLAGVTALLALIGSALRSATGRAL